MQLAGLVVDLRIKMKLRGKNNWYLPIVFFDFEIFAGSGDIWFSLDVSNQGVELNASEEKAGGVKSESLRLHHFPIENS